MQYGGAVAREKGEITIQEDNKLVENYSLYSHSNPRGFGENPVLLK